MNMFLTYPRKKQRDSKKVLSEVMHIIRSETLGETFWREKSRQQSRQKSHRESRQDSRQFFYLFILFFLLVYYLFILSWNETIDGWKCVHSNLDLMRVSGMAYTKSRLTLDLSKRKQSGPYELLSSCRLTAASKRITRCVLAKWKRVQKMCRCARTHVLLIKNIYEYIFNFLF